MRKIWIGSLAALVLLSSILLIGGEGSLLNKLIHKNVQQTVVDNPTYADDATSGGTESITSADLTGDVNGDGEINNKDVGLLMRYLDGWSVEIDAKTADVNADGEIDDKDLDRLQLYVDEWDVEFVVQLPQTGYSPDKRIRVGTVSLDGNVVTIEIKNTSSVWETEDDSSYFEYTCYDRDDAVLSVGRIDFGYIRKKSSKTCTFTIPWNTAKVELTDFAAEYWSSLV